MVQNIEIGNTPVQKGGCWICSKKTENMEFDTEYDTHYHRECLEKFNCKNIHEYEKKAAEAHGNASRFKKI